MLATAPAPTPVSLFSMWNGGGSSVLSQPFQASPCPWSLKVLHGHCFIFPLEDLGARLMEQGWPPKPVLAPLRASFCPWG